MQMEINGAFQAFKIEPKNEDEVEHQKQGMPKDCAYAMAAMLHNNHVEVAKRCSQCLSETLEILAAGPDGQSKLNIGQAILCWDCGKVGIPKNYDEILKAKTGDNGDRDSSAPPSARARSNSSSSSPPTMPWRWAPDGSLHMCSLSGQATRAPRDTCGR